MVLFSAFGAVFGMMFFNRIPRFHHPVFYSEKFSDVSSDAFYVSIEVFFANKSDCLLEMVNGNIKTING